MGEEWSQIPGEGTDPSSVDLLRAEFPFDAPPRSVLRRYRLALLTGAVLLLAGVLVFAYVRVRTLATYTSERGEFTLDYERRFSDIGHTPLASTAEAHIAETAFTDGNADARHGDDPNTTGFRIIVEPAPACAPDGTLDEIAADWRRRQAAAASAGETVERPYEVTATGAGPGLRTVLTRRYEEWLWHVETYAFIRGDRVYWLTFSARAGEWDELWPHFAKSLESFRITYEPPGT